MRVLRPIKEKHAVPEPPEDGCLNERQTVAAAKLVTVVGSVKRRWGRLTQPINETSRATL